MLTFDRPRHFLAPEDTAGGSTDAPAAETTARQPTPGGPDVISDDPQLEPAPKPEPTPEPKAKGAMTQEDVDRLVQLDRENWQNQQKAKALEAELAELKTFKESFDRDPYAAAKAAGLDLDRFTDRELNDGQPTPQDEIASLKQELADIKEFRAGLERQQQDQATQQKYSGMANEVEQYVASNADQFGAVDQIKDLNKELGGGFDLTSFVRQQVETKYNQTGKVLTPAEISGILHKEALSQIEKMVASPTLRKLVAESLKAEQGKPKEPDTPAEQPQTRRPVTSNLESGSETESLAELPHQERLRRIVAKAEAGGYDYDYDPSQSGGYDPAQ